LILARPYEPADEPRVRELHQRQGLKYELPALHEMSVRIVIEENGIITHAGFLRLTTEAYWLFEPGETKRRTLGRLMMLQREMNLQAKNLKLNDVHCWLPPELSQRFGKILLKLGWKQPLWTCFAKEVK